MPRALGGDAAGTVYVAGHTSETLPGQTSAGGTDAFLRSYDESGNERWTRQFGASGEDTACCVAVGPDGTVLVSGHVNGSLPGQAGSGGPDVFVRAYDGDGNERWTRQLGASDVLRPSVSVDGSGNVFVVALGYPEGPVRSYDSEGVELPLRSLGEAADQIGFDANGNAYAVRYTTDARGLDSVVTKYDGDGNVSWTWPLATSEQDVATALRVGQSGPVYVAGDTMGAFSGQTNLGERDVFVSQVDEHGREAWTQQIGTSATDLVGAVSADDVGNVYLVGSSWGDFPGQTSDVLDDAFLMKMPPLDSVSSPP